MVTAQSFGGSFNSAHWAHRGGRALIPTKSHDAVLLLGPRVARGPVCRSRFCWAAPGQDRVLGFASGSESTHLPRGRGHGANTVIFHGEGRVGRETSSFPEPPMGSLVFPLAASSLFRSLLGASWHKDFQNVVFSGGLIHEVGVRGHNSFGGFVQIAKRDAQRCLFNVRLASPFNVNTSQRLEVTNDTPSCLAQLISKRKCTGRARNDFFCFLMTRHV